MIQHYVVTISPKGQFTLPAKLRRGLRARKFVVKLEGDNIFLMACRVVMEKRNLIVNQKLAEEILQLNEEEKLIYNLIREEPVSTNGLTETTSFEVKTVNILLVELEFKGLIRRSMATGLWSPVGML